MIQSLLLTLGLSLFVSCSTPALRAPSSLPTLQKIPFSDGGLDPSNYRASAVEFSAFEKMAVEKGNAKGITREICETTEDDIGYQYICMLVDAERKLKELPAHSPFKKLHPAEIAAFRWYADFGYQEYNDALRSGDPTLLDPYELMIKLTVSGLNKLPRHTSPVVRCDSSGPADSPDTATATQKAQARYPEGEVVQIRSFWSTSRGTDPDYIKQWIVPCRVQINIEPLHSGADVAKLSSRPFEQEVLFRPLAHFKILSKKKSLKDGVDFYQISAKEVEAP